MVSLDDGTSTLKRGIAPTLESTLRISDQSSLKNNSLPPSELPYSKNLSYAERAGMCAAETNTKTPKQNLQTKDKAMASDSDLV